MRPGRSRSGTGLRGARAMLALSVAATSVPAVAHAGPTALPLLVKKRKPKDGLTPEQAADRRMPIQEQGRQMIAAGELNAATILFDGAAQSHGDPVLFIDAGDVYLQLARDERDIATAETAKLRAQTAQDILYFQLDSVSDPDYQPVTSAEIPGLLARAGQLVADADALVREIEAEQEALANPEPEPERRRKGSGRGLRLAGIGFMALGGVGLGVGVGGLVMGGINQSRVDDPAVYGPEFDTYDAKGRTGNTIAVVGLAVGGVALATGVTLFIIGKRRGASARSGDDQAPADAEPTEDPSLAIVPTGRGLALTGRF